MPVRALLCAAFAFAAVAPAATLASNIVAGARADPPNTQAGSSVTITVTSTEDRIPANCGLRVEFGDGGVEDSAVAGPGGQFPRSFTRVYAQPGSYTVRAAGRPFGDLLPCGGSASVTINVSAAPAAPAAAGPAGAPPAPPPTPGARPVIQEFSLCPAGWTQSGDTAKDGSFTCLPAKPRKLECPEGLVYFEKAGTMGCRRAGGK